MRIQISEQKEQTTNALGPLRCARKKACRSAAEVLRLLQAALLDKYYTNQSLGRYQFIIDLSLNAGIEYLSYRVNSTTYPQILVVMSNYCQPYILSLLNFTIVLLFDKIMEP